MPSPTRPSSCRVRLIEGDASAWPTLLAPLEKSPAQVGAVLGPLLRDRTPKAAAAGAYAAAWLTERAGRDGEILLGEDIVARAKDDPAWVAAVRGALAGEGKKDPKAFATLLAFARTRLQKAEEDPILGAEAAWLLRFSDDQDVARELASAWDTGVGGVRTAAADALEGALSYRFASAAAAHTFFTEHKDATFGEWLRLLSVRKDSPESELYRRLVREATTNIERIDRLEALEPYLLATETRWVELRRLAARRAQKVEATPDAWVALLGRVLATEDDHETLTSLLDLADRLPSAPRAADDPFLRLVQERLRGCCSLEPSVAPAITKGLLRVLAKVGGPRDVEMSFQVLPASAPTDVLDMLLTVAGQVGGVEQRLLEFHAARLPREGRPDEADGVALRARALEALAYGGERRPKPAAALAAAYLCDVLIGADPAKREPSPAARRAAVRGLDGFPGPETAECLRTLITLPGEDPGIARLAVSVLGRLAGRDRDRPCAPDRGGGPPDGRRGAHRGLEGPGRPRGRRPGGDASGGASRAPGRTRGRRPGHAHRRGGLAGELARRGVAPPAVRRRDRGVRRQGGHRGRQGRARRARPAAPRVARAPRRGAREGRRRRRRCDRRGGAAPRRGGRGRAGAQARDAGRHRGLGPDPAADEPCRAPPETGGTRRPRPRRRAAPTSRRPSRR